MDDEDDSAAIKTNGDVAQIRVRVIRREWMCQLGSSGVIFAVDVVQRYREVGNVNIQAPTICEGCRRGLKPDEAANEERAKISHEIVYH